MKLNRVSLDPPPLYWIWLSSAFVGDDVQQWFWRQQHWLATSLRLHLSSWYLYIAAFFMASNWDLFSASLGALSLAHCWLFQSSSRLQQTKKCNAPCVPRQKSAKLKLHASVAGACQWPTYLHDQLHQKSPKTLVENQAKKSHSTLWAKRATFTFWMDKS